MIGCLTLDGLSNFGTHRPAAVVRVAVLLPTRKNERMEERSGKICGSFGQNEETYSTEDVRGVSKERASLGSRARKSPRSNSLVPLLLTLLLLHDPSLSSKATHGRGPACRLLVRCAASSSSCPTELSRCCCCYCCCGGDCYSKRSNSSSSSISSSSSSCWRRRL